MLLEVSRRRATRRSTQEAIDDKLEEAFEGSRRASEAEDAKELAEWCERDAGRGRDRAGR